jgi:hypothetical protein
MKNMPTSGTGGGLLVPGQIGASSSIVPVGIMMVSLLPAELMAEFCAVAAGRPGK